MRFKLGVDKTGIYPGVWVALGMAEMVYREVRKPLIVTSLKDGVHSVNSLHYVGKAADLRTRHLEKEEKQLVYMKIKAYLDPLGFDVLLETNPEHIHIEYDPKGTESWEIDNQ